MAKAENAHPFHPFTTFPFTGLKKSQSKIGRANFAAEERAEVSSVDGLKSPCLCRGSVEIAVLPEGKIVRFFSGPVILEAVHERLKGARSKH